jgi:hypothetical protein
MRASLTFWLVVLSCLATPLSAAPDELESSGLGEPVSTSGVGPVPSLQTQPFAGQITRFEHGDPSAQEQLMLELINRARLAPTAEAARLGIGLNDGLEPGAITATPKQPLAFHPDLITSSRYHSQWMLDTDTFSHAGSGGSTPGDRMAAAGYPFSGTWAWGENIAWSGSTGTISATDHTYTLHELLFKSPGHRRNLLNEDYDEFGSGLIVGLFQNESAQYNTLMGTQNFARSDGTPGPLLTGVVYSDLNGNGFYDVGEGVPDVSVNLPSGSHYAVTSSSGGYALPYSGAGTQNVVFSGGSLGANVNRAFTGTGLNVKLDLNVAGIGGSIGRIEIAAVYVAFFERAPDYAGLKYWADQAGSGAVDFDLMRRLTNGFAQHPSYTAIYGGLSDSAFVDAIYLNIGGAPADADGKAYWLARLSGGMTRPDFIAQFILDLLSYSEATLDQLVIEGVITPQERDNALLRKNRLTNKAVVALAFANILGSESNLSPGTNPNDPASLAADPAYRASVKIIADVTQDMATRVAALAYLDTHPSIEDINGGSTPTEPEYTLFTNPTDSQLLSVVGTDGAKVDYFGKRNADGVPLGVDNVIVTSPEGDEVAIAFDDQNRPVRMRVEDGTTFTLTYLADNEIGVSAVSPDGTAQVETSFKGWDTAAAGRFNEGDTVEAANLSLPAVTAANIGVQVSRCGQAVTDAVVNVYVSRDDAVLFQSWYGLADHVGGGLYEAGLPSNLAPPITGENLLAAAQTLAGWLGNLCTFISTSGNPEVFLVSMCPAIGAALTTVSGPGGVAIGAACLKISAAVLSYCKVLGEGGVPGAPSLAERILGAIKEARDESATKATYKAIAYVPGLLGGDSSEAVTAPAYPPYPLLTINVLDKARIGKASLSPAAPAAKQSYTISVELLCGEEGDTLKVDVVGTDNFTRSQTFVSTGGTNTYSLSIPGGAQGVQDSITITLRTLSGVVETRVLQLSFGGG